MKLRNYALLLGIMIVAFATLVFAQKIDVQTPSASDTISGSYVLSVNVSGFANSSNGTWYYQLTGETDWKLIHVNTTFGDNATKYNFTWDTTDLNDSVSVTLNITVFDAGVAENNITTVILFS